MKNKLKLMLNKRTYEHSQRVKSLAIQLAEVHGVDVKKAEIAGLLHDCAKAFNREEMIVKCKNLELMLTEYELKHPYLIHAKLGVEIARGDFGINDKGILNAIRFHSTGRTKMSKLEKVVFVANQLDRRKQSSDIKKLRKVAFQDLNEVMEIFLNEIK